MLYSNIALLTSHEEIGVEIMDASQQNTRSLSEQTKGSLTIASLPEGFLEQLVTELDNDEVISIDRKSVV